MIKRFKHKGLQDFYQSGSTRGIQSKHVKRLSMILALLDVAEEAEELDLPGLFLHPLKGDLNGFWSVRVSGNWRVIFRFTGKDIELVDYLDYH